MTLINIPIGRGTTRSNFQKPPEIRASNTLEFTKRLADLGKMIILDGISNGTANAIEHIVPNGTTFYLLSATLSSDEATQRGLALVSVVGGSNNTIKRINFVNEGIINDTTISYDGNGNDAIAIRSIGAGDFHASLIGYQENTISFKGVPHQ